MRGCSVHCLYCLLWFCWAAVTSTNSSTVTHNVAELGTRPKSLVAVLLSGQTRSLPRTFCSIHGQLLRPLMQDYEVHLFMMVERDGTEHATRLFRVRKILPRRQLHLYATYRPHTPPKCQYLLGRQLAPEQLRIFGCRYAGEVLSQFWYRERIYNISQTWVATNKRNFEWYVFGRCDTVFATAFPQLHSLATAVVHVPGWDSWHGINDRFAISHNTSSWGYASLYSALCELGAGYAMNAADPPLTNVEMVYRWHLERSGIRISPLREFYFGRLRRNDLIPMDLGTMGVASCGKALWYVKHCATGNTSALDRPRLLCMNLRRRRKIFEILNPEYFHTSDKPYPRAPPLDARTRQPRLPPMDFVYRNSGQQQKWICLKRLYAAAIKVVNTTTTLAVPVPPG